MKWYEIKNIEEIDSPSLVVYPNRVHTNIQKAIDIAGNASRLRPHVKTHKMENIIKIHSKYGIHKFKCATIAEAEMIAMAGGKDVLLAHQPTLPKIVRLLKLISVFPNTNFKTIVDNIATVKLLNDTCQANNVTLEVLLDIDNGNRRSGIIANEKALQVYTAIYKASHLICGGLHVYDGHLHQDNFKERKIAADNAYKEVEEFIVILKENQLPIPRIVCGGSPSFPVHALRDEVELSPGTYVFWDAKMKEHFKDMDFQIGALVVTRIISKLSDTVACVDLGHKSIASENPIHHRVKFLNCEVSKFDIHSEEHLVIVSDDLKNMTVGDVLYGVPYHICPTVALHENAHIIKHNEFIDTWNVVARKRKITV